MPIVTPADREFFEQNGYVVIGSPDTVREQLEAASKELNIGNMCAMLQFGKLLLVAVERGMHPVAGTRLEDRLDLVVGLVLAVHWRLSRLQAACLAEAGGQQLVVEDIQGHQRQAVQG